MSDLNSAFIYSEPAQASYSNFSGLSYNPLVAGDGNWDSQEFIDDLRSAHGGGFTNSQAKNLSDQGWVFAYQSETALYGQDYSGTLFYNTQTGEYVLANRGTLEAVPDIVFADGLGIVMSGAAKLQITQMIDFYERLSTPAGQKINFSQDQITAITKLFLKTEDFQGNTQHCSPDEAIARIRGEPNV